MNLLSLLLFVLGKSSVVDMLAKKTGLSEATIKKLIPLAAPILLKALTSNASQKDGAESLLKALSQHTSTETVDKQLSTADTEDGGKILQHILGSNKGAVTSQLAEQTGISKEQVILLLSILAPVLLSALSAANSSHGQENTSDAASPLSLMGLLGGQAQEATTDANVNGSALLNLLAALAK